MSKQFEAKEVKLHKLHTDDNVFSNKLYSIPEYQRPYVWDEEKIEEFWEDIMEEKENKDKDYFMGNLLVMKPNGSNRSDIIDGQQRITTFTILFLVLRHFFNQDSKILKVINRSISDDFEGYKRLILQQETINQRILNDIYGINTKEELKLFFEQNKNDKQFKDSNVFKNAKKFFELAEKTNTEELLKFTDYVLENITLLFIECTNEDDALKIFNTINSKGEPLSQVDIIKVRMLNALKDNQDAKKQFNDNWKEIMKILDGEEWDHDFVFTSYYLSHVGRNLQNNLSKSFEVEFIKNKLPNDILKLSQEILKSMQNYINKYEKIETDKYSNMLDYLPWTSYIDAIIFATFRNISSETEQKELLKKICQFYFLQYIAGSNINTIKQTSFNIIKAIKEKSEIDEILNRSLREKNIIMEAKANLKSENVYNSKWIKPLLLSIEYRLVDDSGYLDLARYQIEHILPQTPNASYNFTQEEHEENHNKLGNLTLLSKEGRKNPSAGNKPFIDKLKIYQGLFDNKKTNSELTRKVIDGNINDPTWSIKKIDARTIELIKITSELLNVKLD
jgi:uncharacterized protein with ParB-like and HNH nuclease domain